MNSSKPSGSGHGGARPGAGRPEGSLAKITREARALAQASGKLPHEMLLDMARGVPLEQLVITHEDEDGAPVYTKKFIVPSMDMRHDAMKAAAPYYAPKISTVEMISGVSEDDLDAIIAGAAAQAGVGIGFDGESTQDEDTPRPRERRAVSSRT